MTHDLWGPTKSTFITSRSLIWQWDQSTRGANLVKWSFKGRPFIWGLERGITRGARFGLHRGVTHLRSKSCVYTGKGNNSRNISWILLHKSIMGNTKGIRRRTSLMLVVNITKSPWHHYITMYGSTFPERNFSTMPFIIFLDMFLSPEWNPTRNSHFQRDKDFKFPRMNANDLATMILFTKTIHFMTSCGLLKKIDTF